MKNLFLIDGASGTGKTDFLRYIAQFHADAVALPKLTTRPRRPYEVDDGPPLDLVWVSDDQFRSLNPKYQYKYSGSYYGFSKDALDDALNTVHDVFVIVRNAKVIERLISDYSFINVVPAYIYTDQERVVKRLQEDGIPETQIRERIDRLNLACADYLKHPSVYAEIIINNSTYTDCARIIDGVVHKYADTPVVEEDLVFVLMSFEEGNSKLLDYYGAIREKRVRSKPSSPLHAT